MENRHFLEKPSSFWITIGSAIVASVIAFGTLTTRVNAIEDKQVIVESDYSRIENKIDALIEKVNQTNINQAQMKTDIDYIKKAVIIVQDR